MGSAKKPQTPAKKEVKSGIQRHNSAASSGSPYSTPTRAPLPKKKGSASKSWSHSHLPPRQEERAKNGRHEGRNLITWTRPRMAEKLLLHMQYECSRYKIDLPWDSIAHRLHPGSSGGAILQHINRLRGTLVAEGHLVPPICQKPGSRVTVDPTVRGYLRKFLDGPDTVTTRPVPFTEPMDDRKFNLPDAYDNQKIPATIKRENQGGAARKPSVGTAVVKEESPDPADLASDDDYNPEAEATAAGRRRSARAKPAKSYIEDNDNTYDPDEDDQDFPAQDETDDTDMGEDEGANSEEDQEADMVDSHFNGKEENFDDELHDVADEPIAEHINIDHEAGSPLQSVAPAPLHVGHSNGEINDVFNAQKTGPGGQMPYSPGPYVTQGRVASSGSTGGGSHGDVGGFYCGDGNSFQEQYQAASYGNYASHGNNDAPQLGMRFDWNHSIDY